MAELDYAQEIAGCKALLLEMIRRAAYDWVLYRDSTRLKNRKIAQDAYIWLFVEDSDHPDHRERAEVDAEITGFLAICDALDLDPAVVRKRAKEITIQEILSVGRPPSYRKAQNDDEDDADDAGAFDLGGLKSKVDELMSPVDDSKWMGRWESGDFGKGSGGTYE